MQALVLVGGMGTRLRPLTETVPKPVLRLVDRPFISYMVEWLAGHGVEEVVLACGFLPDALRDVLGDGEPGGPRLRYLTEPEPRGTAGAIKFAEPELEDRFLALNGDTLTDLDLTALVRAHEERGAAATIALHPVEDPSAYGLVRTGSGGEVLEFLEKPEDGAADPSAGNEINAGAYVLERSVLDLVPPEREVSIEREVFPRMVGEGLTAVRLEGYWMDIGTPDRYLQAGWDILEQRVQTRVPVGSDGVLVDEGAELGAASVAGPAFADRGCRAEEGTRIGPRAVIGTDCVIRAGAEVRGSVLLDGCEVGAGALVEDSILGPGAVVEEGAEVRGGVHGEAERVPAGR
jgi:mannose-1-phosphate guanylyltransferase